MAKAPQDGSHQLPTPRATSVALAYQLTSVLWVGMIEAAESYYRKPTAIILEPSKDLAEQTHDFMNRFKQYLTQPQLRCELLIGGTNPKQASRALQEGEGVDIITGTPGSRRPAETANTAAVS